MLFSFTTNLPLLLLLLHPGFSPHEPLWLYQTMPFMLLFTGCINCDVGATPVAHVDYSSFADVVGMHYIGGIALW